MDRGRADERPVSWTRASATRSHFRPRRSARERPYTGSRTMKYPSRAPCRFRLAILR
jgi:hypothetical protein